MAFEDVYLVSDKLEIPPKEELDDFQQWLSAPIPQGYIEYMTTLGSGSFCDLIEVLTPTQIRESRDAKQMFVREFYRQFWGNSEGTLSLEQAANGILFAISLDGDEIYYLPDTCQLVVLPRHDNVVFWLESGFFDPMRWSSGARRNPIVQPNFRYFEPSGECRRVVEFFTAGEFNLASLASSIQKRWALQDVRTRVEEYCWVIFSKAIQGRLQLTQGPGDQRVGVRIDYDNECSSEVEMLASELTRMGFFETWRHPSGQ